MGDGDAPIYVDMDDVLCDTTPSLLALFERTFGRSVDVEDMVSFELNESLQLTPSEFSTLMSLIHEPQELESLPPRPGALETIRGWSEEGHLITIVTGRPPGTIESSRKWLAEHEVPYESLTYVDKYHRYADSDLISLDQLKEHDYSFAVEDSFNMARFLAEEMGVHVALMDRPWNRKEGLPSSVYRCVDWSDVREGQIANSK